MDEIVFLNMKDCLLNNVVVLNEEESTVLSLKGKLGIHGIQADPLNVQVGKVLAKDDIHNPDEINPDHPVVDMESVRILCVAHYRGGQEVDRQVEAVIHHEEAIHLVVSRNGANFT